MVGSASAESVDKGELIDKVLSKGDGDGGDPRWVQWANAQNHVTVQFDRHERDMAYIDVGPTSSDADPNAPPVFMLHGIPTWSFMWRDIVSALSDQRRVIIPDMVGYGESAQTDDFDRSIRANEEAFEGLLDALGIHPSPGNPIDLVGHDLGGGVFLRYAVHNPDNVRKLVLSNSVQYNSWALEPVCDLAQPANIQNLTNNQFAEILEDFYQLGMWFGDAIAPELDPIGQRAENQFTTAAVSGTSDTANPAQDAEYEWRWGPEVLIGPDAPTETIPEGQKEFIFGNLFPYVRRGDQGRISVARNAHSTNTSHTTEVDPSEITADTLLLWGADDIFQPVKWAFRLEEDIENACAVPLDQARHWVTEDRPQAYRANLREFILSDDFECPEIEDGGGGGKSVDVEADVDAEVGTDGVEAEANASVEAGDTSVDTGDVSVDDTKDTVTDASAGDTTDTVTDTTDTGMVDDTTETVTDTTDTTDTSLVDDVKDTLL